MIPEPKDGLRRHPAIANPLLPMHDGRHEATL
jgi:hypothetical protein